MTKFIFHCVEQEFQHLPPYPNLLRRHIWNQWCPWKCTHDDPESIMERSTCSTQSIYAVDSDVVALASCDNAHALRHHRTARGRGCEALRVRTNGAELCAGTCRPFTSQQAVWSSGPFSSQTHGSPWFVAIYYLFMLLINFSQLHKWKINGLNG